MATELWSAAEVECNKLHQGLAEYKQETEKKIHVLVQENDQLEHDKIEIASCLNSSREEVGKLQKRQFDTEESLHAYRMKAEDLDRELVACKDEIFGLQPPGQVTDAEICQEWEDLCAHIDQWIDDESGHMDDLPRAITKNKPNTPLDSAVENLQSLEKHHSLVSQNSGFLDDVTRHIIHDFLRTKILDDSVSMLGLHSDERKLLATLEKSLAGLKPRRGK